MQRSPAAGRWADETGAVATSLFHDGNSILCAPPREIKPRSPGGNLARAQISRRAAALKSVYAFPYARKKSLPSGGDDQPGRQNTLEGGIGWRVWGPGA